MLNIGQEIFIPKYGAGIVKDIGKKEIVGVKKEYVTIFIFIDEMNIMIPLDKLDKYNIRSIVSPDEMKMALEIIKDKIEEESIEKNWTKRYRKNNGKVNKGITCELCEVIRDLNLLKLKGILPMGEEKILNRAKEMVESEIMLIYNISLKSASEKIES